MGEKKSEDLASLVGKFMKEIVGRVRAERVEGAAEKALKDVV